MTRTPRFIGSCLSRHSRDLLTRPELAVARGLFVSVCRISREHSASLAEALKTYGDHGPNVSGIGRDHFPECRKSYLRSLARNVGTLSDAAWAAKPPRVRRATMRALARAVARRDGSGLYGPQS